jgi:hypothetical protein
VRKDKSVNVQNLLCLDTQLPWTKESFEIAGNAIGNSRLSNREPSPMAIAMMVEIVAGHMTREEAVQRIIEYHTNSEIDISTTPGN